MTTLTFQYFINVHKLVYVYEVIIKSKIKSRTLLYFLALTVMLSQLDQH